MSAWRPGTTMTKEIKQMFKIFRKELDWNGTPLVLETGKVARQADGAVMVGYGETTVLCTAVAAQSPKPGQDFFLLTVNYQEKALPPARSRWILP